MVKRVGLYGGSFNPIHIGHLIVAQSIVEQLELTQLIFLPAAHPPHKMDVTLAPGPDRHEMVRRAIQDTPTFAESDFDLTRKGPSFTIETIAHFRKTLGPHANICWIIGADSLADLPNWHRVADLVDACDIITAGRPGWGAIDFDSFRSILDDRQIKRLRDGILDTPLIDIAATDIRNRVHAGLSIQYLVPESVRAYIAEQGLYR